MVRNPKRKLAAILFTGLVGFTPLRQKDGSKARELISEPHILEKKNLKMFYIY